jgi:ubiquitin-protein ligase E3 C
VIRLVTAPNALVPLTRESPLVAPLVDSFLAVPALPASIPLPSLTHLSSSLPLFSVLLPAAAANPSLLERGRLKDELGRTYFLANLATFGITGGMLQRAGAPGMRAWMAVLGTLLPTLGEGWGVWAERSVSGAGAVAAAAVMDIDDEAVVPVAPARARLPPGVAKPLALLASPQHVGTLASHATNAGSLSDFSTFALSVLGAFRGSPKWEGTLDALLDGNRGRALIKLLWREGVRGKWTNTADQWTLFSTSKPDPTAIADDRP